MQQAMNTYQGAKRDIYGQQWGFNTPHPALETIAPALDIILTRPYDPCHSEFAGLLNLAHFLFRDGILNSDAVQEYTLQLRAFQFPPGVRHLQSPKHHLSSYEMSAHGLWGRIIPVFLRGWLQQGHLKQGFCMQASQYDDPVNFVVTAMTAMARSSTVLMSNTASKDDYDNIEEVIREGRDAFNRLCHVATMGSSRAGSRAGSVASRAQSVVDVEATQQPAPGPSVEATQAEKETAFMYMKDTMRPNIHIGMHYHDFAAEYAMMVNCNTLTGEDLHR